MMPSRRTFLTGLGALTGAVAMRGPAVSQDTPHMTVWRSPSCGCCGSWVDRIRTAGFKVTVESVDDLDNIKRLAGVRDELISCHTARIGGYTIEGHVPAADIRRLLAERPDVQGLAVPGMPIGSPGMESPDGSREPYEVLAFKGAKTYVFSKHR